MKKAIRDFTLDEAKSPWIMPGKIAIGHVHIVLGEPGAGVSPALVSLAAHVSDGTDWPGTMGECLTADVVYIDAVRAETPQLAAWFKASRADCDRVHELNFDYRAEVKVAISKLVEDMGQICDARLLVVDDLEGWREQNQLERGRGSFILGEVFHELLRLAQTKGLAIIVAAKLSLNDATAQREIEAYMRFTSISTVFRVMRGEDDVRELVVLRNWSAP